MNKKRILAFHYSYLSVNSQSLLKLVPPVLRDIIYRLMLKKMGKEVYIDQDVYFRYPWKISIGSDVAINRGCNFYPSYQKTQGEIILGNHIRIAPHVQFFAAGHDHSSLKMEDTAGTIVVKDHVWIGGNSTILQGVTIGEGVVVGAGSVVTVNLLPYKIYAGVPAKEIGVRKMDSAEK